MKSCSVFILNIVPLLGPLVSVQELWHLSCRSWVREGLKSPVSAKVPGKVLSPQRLLAGSEHREKPEHRRQEDTLDTPLN